MHIGVEMYYFFHCLWVCVGVGVCGCVHKCVCSPSFYVVMCLCMCYLACVMGTVYRGLFSSCGTALWDSIRLPCITALRQLWNSYFWSRNKACGFLPQQIFCVCVFARYISVSRCARTKRCGFSGAREPLCAVFAGEQRVPIFSDVCLCSDGKVGLA